MGAYPSIAVYFVPRFFQFIRKAQADLTMSFFTGSSGELIKALLASKVDFIISIDPPQVPEFFHTEVFENTYSLYRRVGYPEKTANAPIFTLARALDSNGKSLLNYLKDAKLHKNIADCSDFESVKAMVEFGSGLGFMPDRVAAPLVLSGKIEKVSGASKLNGVGNHKVVFSCRKHRQADVAINWIRDQILLVLKSKV